MAEKKKKKGWMGPYPPGQNKDGTHRPRTPSPNSKAARIVREQKIAEFILRGWSSAKIAAELGVTRDTVKKYQRKIAKKWQEKDANFVSEALHKHIRMHELAASEAYEAWQDSKKDEEQIITSSKMVRCPECKGKGVDPRDEDEDCPNCDGDGRIKEDVVTRKVKGKAGDATLLKEFRENVKAISGLAGLASPKKVEIEHTGQIEHTHEARKISEDNRFKDVPEELVLEVLSVMEKVEKAKQDKDDIIDVQMIEEEKVEVED